METKRILRYVQGTLNMVFYYYSHGDVQFVGYSDLDWASYGGDRKSTIGYVLSFISSPISWCSKKQSIIDLSTIEAEYTTTNEVTKEITWL